MEPQDRSNRVKVVLYCNGEMTWCYEDEIYDPPEDSPESTRKNYSAYNEEEKSDN